MSERTGKTVKTAHEGVVLFARDDDSFEVERDGIVIGTVAKYMSTTEVKAGKVRASSRRRAVARWNAQVRGGRGSYNITSRKDAVDVLLRDAK